MNRNQNVTDPENAPSPRVMPFAVAPERIDPDAAKVVRRLVRGGYTAYLVGGCVRDLLLDRNPKDWDVATSARPNEVRSLFRNCRIIGRRFRLAHILFGPHKIIETATFRKDPSGLTELSEEWDGDEDEAARRAREDQDLLIRHDNVWGTPPEDAMRRDFTMNALFYDLERREVVDHVGGLDDIRRRVIRTIGDADVRFREDPVRILRAVKFAARLDLGIEPDVYDAILAHRDDLLRSARPRLLEELLRLLRGGAARRSFWLLWETGTLAVLLPELSAWIDDTPWEKVRLWRRLDAIDAQVRAGEVPTDAVLFCALMHDTIDEALDGTRDLVGAVSDFLDDAQERLQIPRRMFDRVRQIASVQPRIRAGRQGALVRRDFYPEAASLFALDAASRGMAARDIQRALVPKPSKTARETVEE